MVPGAVLEREAAGRCRRCGLPAPSGAAFCCYGCELAAELSAEAASGRERTRAVLLLCLVLSMFVMMLSLFLYAEDVYEATADGGMARLRGVYRAAALLLSTPVVLACGAPLLRRAFRELRRGRLTMDLLVAGGAVAAYALSLASVLRGRGGVYFDTATSALMLGTLGRYLEASARAGAGQRLGSSLREGPQRVKRLWGNASEEVGAAEIHPGDLLEVGVDQTVPVDAEVAKGAQGEVEVSVLTGQSQPRQVSAGDPVPAGAVALGRPLQCVALRGARESTLERLAALARSLREERPRVARWADRFAAWLLPVVCAVALGSLWFWTARAGLERGVVVALAVALAACPCTYGVAVPLTLWLALRRALEEGVLVRSASTLEVLARVRSVAFDKTGTLTADVLRLARVRVGSGTSREEVLSLAAGLEAGSRHPIARALASAAAAPVSEVRIHPGRGVTGRDAFGRELALGSPELLAERGVEVEGTGRVWLARDGALLAELELEERLRPEAREAVAALERLGVRSLVLTGDPGAAALEVTAPLGLHGERGMTPAAKAERLRARGAAGELVAMVGDGLNDGPALASVGPSFALGGGSDLARGMAQVTLVKEDLRLVPWTIDLARTALRLSRRGVWAATAYNAVFLALAAAGWLKPVLAGLSMLTSSLLTVAVAQRMQTFPAPRAAPGPERPEEARAELAA